MHEFYSRIQDVFKREGSNRNRFCKKYGFRYQTMQAYWNTDKLPPGNVLEKLAIEYNVSLDSLLLGRSPQDIFEENPIIARITRFLRQQDNESLLRIDGAMQMFKYLALSSSRSAVDPAGTGALAAGSGRVAGVLDILPERIQTASQILSDLARLIQNSAMGEEEKRTGETFLRQIVQRIYEREGKDEWAELEEVT